jgi:hypothetical protein
MVNNGANFKSSFARGIFSVVGDLLMSLIHTTLCRANSFDYLTELQRHAQNWRPTRRRRCRGTTARQSSGLAYDRSFLAEQYPWRPWRGDVLKYP